jgi:hypothetical protein
MLLRIFVIALLFSQLLNSCRQPNFPEHIRTILEKAGTNSQNIQKVIKHYNRDLKDSLKLKAAYFLIENIDDMVTLDSNCVQANEKYFNFIGKIDRTRLVFPVLTRGVDSMNKQAGGIPAAPDVKFVSELTTASSDFLIKNIDTAFYVWQNMPWAKNISFEDFCEYILPYRCTDTYSSDIRDFFLRRFKVLPDSIKSSDDMLKVGEFIINDLKPWFKEDPNILQKYPFLKPIKFSDLLKGRVGECNDANSVRVAALRALGIATAYDQIPNWGNSNQPHYWYKIIDKKHDTVKSKITNANEERYTQHIISATSFDEPNFEGTPSYVQISYGRTVPKVYRQYFSKQKSSLAWISDITQIPPYFRNIRLKDVTTEYVETAIVRIALNGQFKEEKYAYLCVFDNQKWIPVAWSAINNGTAEFKDMGKNIVYLPAYYREGQLIPAENPLLLTLDGKVETINPSRETETIKVFTKFPLRTYVRKWESYVIGGRLQLANKPDFSDSVTVHTIKSLPFYETEIKLEKPQRSRLLMFQFKGLSYLEISELQFYGLDKNGKEILLKGTPIGNPGYYPYQTGKLFDRIPYNFYRADTSLPTRYVGLDLGENNNAVVTRINYMPYSDDNAVRKGDTYALVYWDNGWKPLAAVRAFANCVSFENVPKGALLLLMNTGGGVQQRIFRYEHGRQMFW